MIFCQHGICFTGRHDGSIDEKKFGERLDEMVKIDIENIPAANWWLQLDFEDQALL